MAVNTVCVAVMDSLFSKAIVYTLTFGPAVFKNRTSSNNCYFGLAVVTIRLPTFFLRLIAILVFR